MYVYSVSMFALPVCRLDIGQSLLRAVLPDVSKQGSEAKKIEGPGSPLVSSTADTHCTLHHKVTVHIMGLPTNSVFCVKLSTLYIHYV